MNKKIEDNPSFKKFKDELNGFKAIGELLKLFPEYNSEQLSKAFNSIPEFEKQLEQLSKSPDKFNEFFGDKGWIAHESMDADLMFNCIEITMNGNSELAEKKLVDYYASEVLNNRLFMLKGVDAFTIRYKFFLLAYEDTIKERYYAAIPILLMMIDGIVNDIDKGKGFFAENTDLTAWDSIAAHSSGLKTLKEIFATGRNKTSNEEIVMPYRNGILHGRDLGYANKATTAKCWAALFAIRDWAEIIKKGKKIPDPLSDSADLTLEESISEMNLFLIEFAEKQKKNEDLNERINNWKPRNLSVGIDIPVKGESKDYNNNTPEQEAIKFVEYWIKNNYGGIVQQINYPSYTDINERNEAGKIRKIFEGKKLLDYCIIEIKDCAPAITEVSLSITIEYNNERCDKRITLRFIYKSVDGSALIFGDKGGKWKFIENFFYQIECP